MSDNRQFLLHLQEMSEVERFAHYHGNAAAALRQFDCRDALARARKRTEGPEHGEDPEDRAAGLVRFIKDEENRGKTFDQLQQLHAEVGRIFLEAATSHDSYSIEAMRKAALEPVEIKLPERVLWRRIIHALAGEYERTGWVPTKRQLFNALDRYPIEVLEAKADANKVRIKYRESGEPKKVSWAQFSNSLGDLNLRDLPESKAGNPEFT